MLADTPRRYLLRLAYSRKIRFGIKLLSLFLTIIIFDLFLIFVSCLFLNVTLLARQRF